MKASITIDEGHPHFASVLALLAGTSVAAIAAPGMPSPFPPMPSGDGDDDDETGPVNTAAPMVDNTGLPWDERIHAATKTLKADGTWKLKKNGPKGDELAAIETQLRAGMQQPVPMMPAPVPQPMPIPAPVMQPQPVPVPQPIPQPMQQPVPMMPAPVVQPMPAPVQAMPQPEPVQTAVAVATGTLDFPQFMQHLSGQMNKRDANGAPLVHADYLAGITNEISTAFAPQGIAPLSAITDIANNPQMITYAVQCMQRDGRW